MSVKRETQAMVSRRLYLEGNAAAAGLFAAGGYGLLTSCEKNPGTPIFLTTPPELLRDIRAMRTVIGGETVWER